MVKRPELEATAQTQASIRRSDLVRVLTLYMSLLCALIFDQQTRSGWPQAERPWLGPDSAFAAVLN